MIKKQLRNYLSSLSMRERWVLFSGGAIAIILLFYALCWHPLTIRIEDLQQRLQEKGSRLNWLTGVRDHLNHLPKSTTKELVSDVMAVTERSLSEAGLAGYLREVSQPESGQLQVVFADIPFDTFIDWLQDFDQQYAVKFLKFKIKSGADSGMVSARMTLKAM